MPSAARPSCSLTTLWGQKQESEIKQRKMKNDRKAESPRVWRAHEIISCSRYCHATPGPDAVTQTGYGHHLWNATNIINLVPEQEAIVWISIQNQRMEKGNRSSGEGSEYPGCSFKDHSSSLTLDFEQEHEVLYLCLYQIHQGLEGPERLDWS